MKVRKTFLAGVFALVVLIAAVASDWPTGWLRDMWAEYAMMTGIVSGMLLLMVTVAFVDEVMQRRSAIRWEAVAHTAFRGLGEAVGDTSEALEALVVGAVRPGRNRFELPWDEKFQARLDKKRLVHAPVNEYGDDGTFREFYTDALQQRLMDPDWCDAAQRATVAIRAHYRIRMTPWLPAMLATPELAAVQNRVALLDLRLMRLQGPILELARMGETTGLHKSKSREEFADLAYGLWQATHLEAAAMTEGLYRASRPGSSYVHRDEPQRNRLDPRHLQALRRIDGDLAHNVSSVAVDDTLDGDLGRGYTVVPPPRRRSLRRTRRG